MGERQGRKDNSKGEETSSHSYFDAKTRRILPSRIFSYGANTQPLYITILQKWEWEQERVTITKWSLHYIVRFWGWVDRMGWAPKAGVKYSGLRVKQHPRDAIFCQEVVK